jgi:hypothetical protein
MDFSVEQKVIPALCNVLPTSKLKPYWVYTASQQL